MEKGKISKSKEGGSQFLIKGGRCNLGGRPGKCTIGRMIYDEQGFAPGGSDLMGWFSYFPLRGKPSIQKSHENMDSYEHIVLALSL